MRRRRRRDGREAPGRVQIPRLDYKARHAVECGINEWL
jgi:hypothetical protein